MTVHVDNLLGTLCPPAHHCVEEDTATVGNGVSGDDGQDTQAIEKRCCAVAARRRREMPCIRNWLQHNIGSGKIFARNHHKGPD